MTELVCTNCDRAYSANEWVQRCGHCQEPLELRQELRDRRLDLPDQGSFLQRYKSVLPPVETGTSFSLGEGATPLIEARRLGRDIGFRELLIKDETQNPTGSFKDRGTVLALHHAIDLGLERVGTVSTGNMAVSVATYAAAMELDCYILVKDTMSSEKRARIGAHCKNLIAVEGDYGELYYRSLEVGQLEGIYFANSDDPYRVEGQKTLIYEIWQALGSEMDACLVLPVSSGGNISAVLKGLDELERRGMLSCKPWVVGVQAEGAAPIATAYKQGKEQISRWSETSTVATAIANPFPPSGNRVLRRLRAYGRGSMETVSDEEILDAKHELSQTEGLSVQPAAAAPIAAAKKLLATGQLAADQPVVCVATGAALKGRSVSDLQCAEVATVPLKELRNAVGMSMREGRAL